MKKTIGLLLLLSSGAYAQSNVTPVPTDGTKSSPPIAVQKQVVVPSVCSVPLLSFQVSPDKNFEIRQIAPPAPACGGKPVSPANTTLPPVIIKEFKLDVPLFKLDAPVPNK